MYQTLTHGFGMMVAQRWMVPQQKYDVIHYIRENYLRGEQASAYAALTDSYLDRLPTGDQRGPEPSSYEPYVAMDYGPSLMQTFEIELNNDGRHVGHNLGRSPHPERPWEDPDEYFPRGGAPNFAYKGIAIRLDRGPGGITRGNHWIVYDHDTMNVHAVWSGSGFVDFANIQYDGRHGVHLRLVGDIVYENPVGPGWAQPLTGSVDDPRPAGRDGRPYGPLPRSWCRYQGTFHHGLKTLIAYSVGGTDVLEWPTVDQRRRATCFCTSIRSRACRPSAAHSRVARRIGSCRSDFGCARACT